MRVRGCAWCELGVTNSHTHTRAREQTVHAHAHAHAHTKHLHLTCTQTPITTHHTHRIHKRTHIKAHTHHKHTSSHTTPNCMFRTSYTSEKIQPRRISRVFALICCAASLLCERFAVIDGNCLCVIPRSFTTRPVCGQMLQPRAKKAASLHTRSVSDADLLILLFLLFF